MGKREKWIYDVITEVQVRILKFVMIVKKQYFLK